MGEPGRGTRRLIPTAYRAEPSQPIRATNTSALPWFSPPRDSNVAPAMTTASPCLAADQGTAEAEEVPNPSDLEFKTEDAEEVKGDPTNTQQDQDAEKRKRDLLRQAMLDSQLGTENNQAGDPDSTTSDRINLGGNGISDPEAARYIDRCRKQVYENFNPLPQLRNADPPFSAKIRVRFDVDTGEVQSWSWVTRSGNASWDGAAERAVESVGRFPPPPAHLQDLFRQGFVFNLTVE